MPETFYLVCAPADAPLCVPKSIFGKECSECRRPVMIAPSGQGFLRDHPDASLICSHCFARARFTGKTQLAAPAGVIAAEKRNAVPNLWKYRN